jgi:DNA-binding NarL/FixJ family response regulator
VDDHPLIREGLAETLAREKDLVVTGQAASRQEALQLIPAAAPHLAIVDLALKDSLGLELIKDLRARFPAVRVLVVSMHDELQYAERAIRAGASGYINKEEAANRVVEAVREVLRGETYVSRRVASLLASRLAIGAGSKGSGASALSELAGPDGQLSDRELEVLELIGDGLGRREIALRLGLDVNTVETYRGRIRQKLNLPDAQALLQFAIRHNRQPRP